MIDTLVVSASFAAELKSRSEYVVELLAGAHDNAAQARDDEALGVAQFLQAHSVVGLPLPGNRIGVAETAALSRRAPVVFIVPVTSVDGILLRESDDAKAFASPVRTGNVWASYHRSQQTIYWARDWRLSPPCPSLILLHEGLHAVQHLAMADAPPTRGAREVAATELESRLLMSIGGSRFRELIDTLARNSKTQNQQAARQDSTARTLDAIFGNPISREDEVTRATFVESCLHLYRARCSVEATPNRLNPAPSCATRFGVNPERMRPARDSYGGGSGEFNDSTKLYRFFS